MKYIILLLVFIFTGCATNRLSDKEIIEAASKGLRSDLRNQYTRVSLSPVETLKHVSAYRVLFEPEDRSLEEGYWVMVDYDGNWIETGKIYANH